MFRAFLTAARQLGDPPIKRVIWRVGLWTAAIYLLVAIALWSALAGLDPTFGFDFIPFDWLQSLLVSIAGAIAGIVVGVLGVFAFFAIFWLLFVVVVQLVAGFYIEDIVNAVEARHYPDLPPASGQSAGSAALTSLA